MNRGAVRRKAGPAMPRAWPGWREGVVCRQDVAIHPTSPVERIPVSCTVRFPCCVSASPILTYMTPQEPNFRVLVVDDNADAADTLASLLTIFDCTVHVAYSGVEALAVGDLLWPQLVFLDIGMPGMDGCETARRMRERPWGGQARIAALTGWGDDDRRCRAAQAVIDAHFTKPVTADALLRFLADVRA